MQLLVPSMAEVLEIRFKSSSRREVGREVHYVLLPCFALLPFHFFMLLSSPQKVKGWETHLPALFILLLGSKSPSFPIAVPRNLDACVQLHKSLTKVLQSLTTLMVVTGGVTVARNICTRCRSGWFRVFMFGLKANKS